MNMTLAGRCRMRVNGREFMVESGVLLLVQAAAQVDWEVLGGDIWHPLWTVFHPRPHWHEWLETAEFCEGAAQVTLGGALWNRVRREMLRLERIYTRGGPHRDLWSKLALERVLITLHTGHALRSRAPDPRVQAAVEWIHGHFAEPLSADGLAQVAHMSRSQLFLLFQRHIGIPPMQYLEQVRLSRAAEMLGFTTLAVQAIAAACGFPDADHFAHRFKRFSGQTPRDYRAQHTAGS